MKVKSMKAYGHYYAGCPKIIGASFKGGKGHRKDSDLHATHGRKCLRSTLGDNIHKSMLGNRPALPQSLELSSPTKEYGTFY
ncbi:hypothetical protein TNCV_2763742 [Trichonephila clavipes]|nr:hypothetical protein TNCV_2763742 [Trichonephila clavipes]